jgi:hypothetical protein
MFQGTPPVVPLRLAAPVSVIVVDPADPTAVLVPT